MTTTAEPPPTRADEPDPGPRRRWSATQVGLTLLVVAMLGFWVWVFLFAPRDNPDKLEDQAFPRRAEEICAATQAAVDALPSPRDTPLPADRAVQVAAGTELTAAMIRDLRAATELITVAEDLETVERWLGDWDIYLADRERHIVKLETADEDTSGRDLAFTVSEPVSGGLYTRRLEGFSNVNDMASCRVPGDI